MPSVSFYLPPASLYINASTYTDVFIPILLTSAKSNAVWHQEICTYVLHPNCFPRISQIERYGYYHGTVGFIYRPFLTFLKTLCSIEFCTIITIVSITNIVNPCWWKPGLEELNTTATAIDVKRVICSETDVAMLHVRNYGGVISENKYRLTT